MSSFLYNPENILIGVNNTFFKKNIIEATLIASDLKFSFTDDVIPLEPKPLSYISGKYSNSQLVNNISNPNVVIYIQIQEVITILAHASGPAKQV